MTDNVTASFLSQEIYKNLTTGSLIGLSGRYEVKATSPINHSSGYYGAIIEDTLTGEGIIVSRGTEPSSLSDLQADLDIVFGGAGGSQFDAAIAFLNDYNSSSNPISVTTATGHSLCRLF